MFTILEASDNELYLLWLKALLITKIQPALCMIYIDCQLEIKLGQFSEEELGAVLKNNLKT